MAGDMPARIKMLTLHNGLLILKPTNFVRAMVPQFRSIVVSSNVENSAMNPFWIVYNASNMVCNVGWGPYKGLEHVQENTCDGKSWNTGISENCSKLGCEIGQNRMCLAS